MIAVNSKKLREVPKMGSADNPQVSEPCKPWEKIEFYESVNA